MFAAIYISDFFLQAALRHEPELSARPVALIDESLPKPAIIQLTEAARRSGVSAGMTSTQAMARCRQIVIKERSSAQEMAAGDALLQTSFLFSPYVEATAPGICTLDLKGQTEWSADFSPHRPNNPAPAEEFHSSTIPGRLLSFLAQLNFRAQVGVAATPAVALQAARHAAPFLRVDDPAAFLAGLPIESLDPSRGLLTILQKWGIRTAGEFLRLGKDALAERLGAEALQLFSRGSPTCIRPLKLAQLPEIFEESVEFENEIESLEPLLFILRRFLDQLAVRLSAASFAAEEILLRLTLSNDTHYERAFKIPAPTTDVNVLFRVLFTHLENVRTEHPIKSLYLRAKPCRPSSEQFGLFDCALRDPNHFYETLGRLNALLGPDRVGIPVPLPTHRPDAFELLPVNFNQPESISTAPPRRSDDGALEPSEKTRFGLPLRRFRPPLPAQVKMHDHHPTTLHSPVFHGRIHHSTGPWRTSGDWWDKRLWRRDEWDVQTANGRLYRLFREQDGWFVEGVYG